jgi:hypothetical protein
VRRDQALDLRARVVIGALAAQVRVTLGRGQRERSIEQLPLPAEIHVARGRSAAGRAGAQRAMHAQKFQSRLTVAGDVFSAAAVCSILSPAEIPHRDDLLEPLVFAPQLLQRLVERFDVDARFLGLDIQVAECPRGSRRRRAWLRCGDARGRRGSGASLCRGAEEMAAILPAGALAWQQPQVGLVDEPRSAAACGPTTRVSMLARASDCSSL